jgi:hypothetical protein
LSRPLHYDPQGLERNLGMSETKRLKILLAHKKHGDAVDRGC